MSRPAEPWRVRRAGPAFRWPGGQRIGLVFNIAYEAWSPGEAPGIGPMGNHHALSITAEVWR